MWRLRIYRKSNLINEVDLSTEQSYVLGRSPQSDIRLDDPSVSRQHARLTFRDSVWNLEILSKYGKMDGSDSQQLQKDLQPQSRFQITPFELELVVEKDVTASIKESQIQEDERTMVAQVELKGLLVRLSAQKSPIEEIELGDEVIKIGSSPECQIKMDGAPVLATLKFIGHTFQIESPLKGTSKLLVNGKSISQDKELTSGDEIYISGTSFKFQLVTPEYQTQLPVPQELPFSPSPSGPPVLRIEKKLSKRTPPQADNSLKRFYMMLGCIILIAVIFYFGDQDKKQNPNDKRNPAALAQKTGLEKLNADQQKYVQETYQLALRLHKEQNYQGALNEVKKVFELAPDYAETSALKADCEQVIQKQERLDQQKRQAEEDAKLKEEVNQTLAECEQLLKQKQYSEIASCTDKLASLDPDNARAQELNVEAEAAMDKLRTDAENRQKNLEARNRALGLFQSGQKALESKNYKGAIGIFNSVLSVSFSGSEPLRAKARLGIQTANTKLQQLSNTLVEEAKVQLEQKNSKEAILKLREALKIRSNNGDAVIMMEKAEQALFNEMKAMYQESIIEEDLGKIDEAKRKWAKIIETDVPTGDYYKKAKLKLRKYEK